MVYDFVRSLAIFVYRLISHIPFPIFFWFKLTDCDSVTPNSIYGKAEALC